MSFAIEGTIEKIYETESKSATFQTREFVIKTEETYPQFVKFQATQDKCSLVDGYNEGDRIKVSFDLRGREWQGKYFTNLNAWKVERAGAASSGGATSGNSSLEQGDPFSDAPLQPFEGSKGDSESFDDLPF